MNLEELVEFRRDVKKLSKKFHSLHKDLETIRKVILVEPDVRPPFSFRIEGLGLKTCVIKIKRMACQSMKGRGSNTGLTLIYAWLPKEKRIVYIEIYFKGDKENEDRERIMKNFRLYLTYILRSFLAF